MTPQDYFIKTVAEIDNLLTILKAHTDNHFDVNPDKIDWSHAGDAKHVREMLREVVSFTENMEE